VFPDVLHVVLSGVHVPLPHLPPQHWLSVVQAWPSAVQFATSHLPPVHASEQQSTDVVQAAPARSQFAGAPPRHVCDFGSHCAEQQSVLTVHGNPSFAQ
jgi:hypothetical protein